MFGWSLEKALNLQLAAMVHQFIFFLEYNFTSKNS
jgi:hypothetical protein